jgi:hypothetical protein
MIFLWMHRTVHTFFHNVISMNVGYCSVGNYDSYSFISWDRLDALPVVNRTKYFKHVRFPVPLEIRMDGSQRLIAVSFSKD